MKHLLWIAVVTSACKPDLGDPQSLVTSSRVLAVRSDPAEVAPGSDLTLTALVADGTGTLAPDVAWGFCSQPAPLSSDNVAGDDCIYGASSLMQRGSQIIATVPPDACSVFGPTPPAPAPGELARRPQDADVTGGYYQPVRVLAKTDVDPIAAIGLTRIGCDLANAPLAAVVQFRASYRANTNPVLVHVVAQLPATADAIELPASLPPNTPVALRVRWSDDSAETFPVFDPKTRTVISQREALRVSWFVSGGVLAAERTGRTEDELETYADNIWTTPDGPAHLWVVVRDSRGGVGFAGFDLP